MACGTLTAAEPVPLGHPDFRPSRRHPVGQRGDGSGLFPGASPVLRFGDGTVPISPRAREYERRPDAATNILWRTPLPNWSNSSPIVAGKRVFLMAEATNTAPILVCIDAATGRMLWQREVDHLDLLEEPDRSEIKRLWSRTLSRARTMLELWAAYRPLKQAIEEAEKAAQKRALADASLATEPDALDLDMEFSLEEDAAKPDGKNAENKAALPPELKKQLDAHERRCRELGIERIAGRTKWGWVSVPGLAGLTPEESARLTRHGCYFHKWELGLHRGGIQTATYVGLSPASPCSDGKTVYVFTGYNCAAAYDLDGNLKWINWLGVPAIRRTSWIAWCQPPVLVGDLLLIGAPLVLTALKADTGEQAWQVHLTDEKPGGGWMANRGKLVDYPITGSVIFSGVPFRLEGEDYFFWMDARVRRVKDGRAVTGRLCGDNRLMTSSYPCYAGDKLFFWAEVGKKTTALHAFGFRGEDDQLGPEEAWTHLPGNGSKPGRGAYGFVHNGSIYERQQIIDAATGEVAAPSDKNGLPIADPWNGYCLGGRHLFAVESVRGTDVGIVRVCDLKGNLLYENYLSCPPETPAQARRIRLESGYDRWAAYDRYTGSFHSALFFAGSRLYIRSRSDLICVGAAPPP